MNEKRKQFHQQTHQLDLQTQKQLSPFYLRHSRTSISGLLQRYRKNAGSYTTSQSGLWIVVFKKAHPLKMIQLCQKPVSFSVTKQLLFLLFLGKKLKQQQLAFAQITEI